MSILSKHLAFVNEQLEFHENYAKRPGINTFRVSLHQSTAEKFRALMADLDLADTALEAASQQTNSPQHQPEKVIRLTLSVEDLEGLPHDLIQELNVSDGDKTEFAIVNAIEEAGGIISLDQLLIALYKKTNEVHKRNSLTSRLARMATKNIIYYVPGKKGAYSTEQLSTADVERIFGSLRQHQEPQPTVSAVA